MSEHGEILLNIFQTKKALDLWKKLSLGREMPDPTAFERFNAATQNGADMSLYQNLLSRAVAAITGKAEEKTENQKGFLKSLDVSTWPHTHFHAFYLFIEGDNLEVLKHLQKSYANKVKMIYIDPPYNTGKEFIYPDKFQDFRCIGPQRGRS